MKKIVLMMLVAMIPFLTMAQKEVRKEVSRLLNKLQVRKQLLNIWLLKE